MKKEQLLKTLLSPHLSEKSAGQHIFKVAMTANKTEIKAAVEMLFQVKVKAVNVMRVKNTVASKVKRTGGGRQTTWKKAYVVLQPGNEISFA